MWARRRGNVLEWWHLIDQDRLPVVAACGEQLGEDATGLEATDESIIGNRCPACQGAALRGAHPA